MSKKVVFIGGSKSSIAAAKRLRRLEEDCDIIIFEKENEISVEKDSLAYYISDVITERQKLIYDSSEELKQWFNIEVRKNSEVESIDISHKLIKVKDASEKYYFENFDYMLLSPGSKTLKPNIAGINSSNLYFLQNLADSDRLKQHIKEANITNIAVISETYMGIQLAESLKSKGKEVVLIADSLQSLLPFDLELTASLQLEMTKRGVKVIQNKQIDCLRDTDTGIGICFSCGIMHLAQIIVWIPKGAPNTDFLVDSEIELSPSGHIKVDSSMKTSVDFIYSAGSPVQIVDFEYQDNLFKTSENTGTIQRITAVENIYGLHRLFNGYQNSFALKLFDITAASTGKSEEALKKFNIPYKIVNVHGLSHEPCYPGATPIYLKLIFADNGMILGAQSMGYENVDKRVDLISAVMRLGGDITTLRDLELCYSPAGTSIKDILNTAGFIAEDILMGMTKPIYAEDLNNLDPEKIVIIDTRSELECSSGCIEGSINIPLEDLRKRADELTSDKELIFYCQYGMRGYLAERLMSQKGFRARNLSGGYETYTLRNYNSGVHEDTSEYNTGNIQALIGGSPPDMKKSQAINLVPAALVDACGLSCPGPLLKIGSSINSLSPGELMKITASDPGFYTDIHAWCKRTNNKLLEISMDKGIITAYIEKRKNEAVKLLDSEMAPAKDNKTIIIFSGDLDKAIASFIIANGAASMGKKVTMFFTFWGLNILRKPSKQKLKKGLLDRMFGLMMPRGSKRLKLSRMSMLGIGGKLIRMVMKNKNIYSLEELIETAVCNGVELVACQMSMDVMGIRKEELIDGVKIAGVGYYIGETEDSNLNLFI